MNAIGFFTRRLLWQFGLKQERHRWSAVTRETQFLAEAQDLLGKLAWPQCDKIDDLSGEYWQILDLDKRQQEMRDQSETLTSENEVAQEKLYEMLKIEWVLRLFLRATF